MTNAYDKLYLAHGQRALGSMLDYAVRGVGLDLSRFYRLFLASGYAKRFGEGEANIIAGHSGIELTHLVLETVGIPQEYSGIKSGRGRSREYWAGTALAYYQWSSNQTFSQIESAVPITEVIGMYRTYHEMDIRRFEEEMERRVSAGSLHGETQLARLRAYANLSQAALAKRAGVPIRTIQQYEQRQKDIRHAGAEHLGRLAKALHCEVETVMAG